MNTTENASWKREPAIDGKFGGCLCCGVRASLFPADGVIAVGFGYAALHKDGQPVWTEPNADAGDDEYLTGAQAEEIASLDPDHDWRIVLEGPLSGRTYQRHSAAHWALIEQNMGFA